MVEQTETKLIITADGSVAIAGMKKVADATKDFETKTKGAMDTSMALWGKLGALLGGGLSVAGIATLVTSTMRAKDELVETAEKIGMSAAALQHLQYVGSQTGTSMEALASGAGILSKKMAENDDVFKALGLSTRDATGRLKTADVMITEIADKFARMEDGTGKTAYAMALFGKSGKEIVPVLNQGSAGLAAMRKEMEGLGYEMDEAKLRRMADLNDQFDKLKDVARNVGDKIAFALLPSLETLSERLIQVSKDTDGFRAFGEGLAGVLDRIADKAGTAARVLDRLFERDPRKLAAQWREPGLTAEQQAEERSKGFMRFWKARLSGSGASGGWEGPVLDDLWSNAPNPMVFGPTRRPPPPFADDKEAGRLKALGDQFDVWTGKIESMNPFLDETDKKLTEIAAQAERFISAGANEKDVEAWRQRAGLYVEAARWLKEMGERQKTLTEYADKERQYNQAAVKARADYEKQAPLYFADDLERRLIEAQRKADDLKDLASRGGLDYEDEAAKIDRQLALEQARIRAEWGAQWEIKKSDAKEAFDFMTEISKQSARNMESALAEGFFIPVGERFQGLGQLAVNMANAVNRAFANMLAKQVITGGGDMLSSLWSSWKYPSPYGQEIVASPDVARFYGYGATGGVFDRPTVISEYGQREAAVPLPDGRSIPVDLHGAAAPNVTINIQTPPGTTARQTPLRFDGKRWVQNVVIEDISSQGPIWQTLKGGG